MCARLFFLLSTVFLFTPPVYERDGDAYEHREDDESDNDKHHTEQCTLDTPV